MNALLATTASAHAVRDDLPKGELTETIALMDMIPIKDKLIERATADEKKTIRLSSSKTSTRQSWTTDATCS